MRKILKGAVIVAFFIIFILMTITFFGIFQREQQVKEDAKRLQALYPNILEGASTGPETITVDYSQKPISTGSPLIFGGSHTPNIEHQEAWDKIDEIGVTMIRVDLGINRSIRNTTLNDYKNNTHNIQDIASWDQNYINQVKLKLSNAKKRDIKTIGIVDYTPPWLSHNGSDFGVPKDWDIFKKLVKTSYSYYRNELDYIEIWNEPSFDHFLNLTNSNLSREEAYKMIFKTSVEAIREVDQEKNDGKKAKIGGPVSHRPFDTSVLEVILKEPNLRKELDFISYHNYDAEHLPEPSDIYFRQVMEKYDVEYLPVFITEWNYMPDDSKPNQKNTGIDAILYTGNKFTDFLYMNLAGANYHSLEQLNPRKPNGGIGYYGFYNYQGNELIMQPHSSTWRLFSNQMGLGKGISQIYKLNDTTDLNVVSFKNSKRQYGVTIVNNSTTSKIIKVQLNNTEIKKFARVKVFYSSEHEESKESEYDGLVKNNQHSLEFTYYIPKQSIVGIIFTEDKAWYNKLHLPTTF